MAKISGVSTGSGISLYVDPMPMSGPFTRTVSTGVAYQATDITKTAFIIINLTSTAAITLAVGTSNSVDIVIGTTTAVTAGTGSSVGKYKNSQTGLLIVGANLNTDYTGSYSFLLPAGYYFSINQITGTSTIVNAFEYVLA